MKTIICLSICINTELITVKSDESVYIITLKWLKKLNKISLKDEIGDLDVS